VELVNIINTSVYPDDGPLFPSKAVLTRVGLFLIWIPLCFVLPQSPVVTDHPHPNVSIPKTNFFLHFTAA